MTYSYKSTDKLEVGDYIYWPDFMHTPEASDPMPSVQGDLEQGRAPEHRGQWGWRQILRRAQGAAFARLCSCATSGSGRRGRWRARNGISGRGISQRASQTPRAVSSLLRNRSAGSLREAVIDSVLKRAEEAAASHDTVAMIYAYREMEGCE